MIKSFAEAEKAAEKVGPKRISVLRAEDREFLLALKEAGKRGYCEPVLIGDEIKIRRIADEIEFDITNFQLVDEKDSQRIADKGVSLVSAGDAHLILRGQIEGHFLYRALIRSSRVSDARIQICMVALFQMPVLPKLIGIGDPAINVAPDFHVKVEIIRNTVYLFSRLGYDNPRVGILTAERGLNAELDSVTDAVKIKEALASGELTGCSIADGLSLSDFFLGKDGFLGSLEEIDSSLIPDIFLVHNIEFGNMFGKMFGKVDNLSPKDYLPGSRGHGIIMSADIPTVVPSRADRHDTIITDIALGVLIA